MNAKPRQQRLFRGRPEAAALLFPLYLLAPPLARADRPLYPLDVPTFSFDPDSPSVGSNGVSPDAVLGNMNTNGPTPQPVFVPGNLGLLGTNGDDLDALSAANDDVSTNAFALLFSVDRRTAGAVPPHPPLVCGGVPFNVQDQSGRGQAASDLFMTTQIFTRAGPQIRPRILPNHVVVINQYNEGGGEMPCCEEPPCDDPMLPLCPTGFQAQPYSPARGVPTGVSQDNVDAAAYLAPAPSLYFSLRAGSPSLASSNGLPGTSGADIFFDPDPNADSDGQTTRFAAAAALCLDPADDIDALIVFDFNKNGIFDASPAGVDQVLFSLAPRSHSLFTTPGANTNGVDVFTASFGPPPCPVGATIFASPGTLGLAEDPSWDNLDALEFVRCDVGPGCDPLLRGVRAGFDSDFDHDGDVDLNDIAKFWNCFRGAGTGAPVPPSLECLFAFDANRDRDIDLEDYDCFAEALTGPAE